MPIMPVGIRASKLHEIAHRMAGQVLDEFQRSHPSFDCHEPPPVLDRSSSHPIGGEFRGILRPFGGDPKGQLRERSPRGQR